MQKTRLLLAGLVVVASACDDNPATQSDDSGSTSATTELAATEPTATIPQATGAPTSAAPDQADSSAPVDPSESSDPTEQGSVPTVPTPTPRVVSPLYEFGDIDRGLQPFIDQAKDDLAAHLAVDLDAISTHAAVLVVWPDASLGCPLPDMRYAQVQTDGSVIELEYDGGIYRYHTGGNRGPFVCEQPLAKTPPTEGIGLNTGDDV